MRRARPATEAGLAGHAGSDYSPGPKPYTVYQKIHVYITFNNMPDDNQKQTLEELLAVPFNQIKQEQEEELGLSGDGSESDKEALRHYLLGEKLLAQNKLSEAVTVFANMRINQPTSKITITAAVREIFSRLQLGQTIELKQTLQWLNESADGDKGLVLSGEISEFIENDVDSAIVFYEQLLQNHPNSLMIEPVRKHIRELKSNLES